MTSVMIDSKKLKELQLAQSKLNALEAGGVDNWEYYDESLESWHKENDYEEALEQFIENLYDVLVDAEVDQPAGSGCGYSINIPTSGEEFLKGLIKEIVKQFGGDK